MQVPGFVSLGCVFVGVTYTRTQVSGTHSLICVRTFLVTYQTGGILCTMGMEYFHEWSRREVQLLAYA